MPVKKWNEFLLPYEQAVEELKVKFKSLRNGLRKVGEYSPIEFTTGRVKKVSSILEKAKKLGISIEEIEEKIEDIAGIRIICQLVDDIYRVVQMVKQRDGRDLKIVYEKDYVKNRKESGYRSYHIIIQYPVQMAQGEKKILAEIQIRTLAMNFWATVEHSLNYKYKHNIPRDIEERIKKAAEAAFRLDQEMSEIRSEIMEAQQAFEIKSNLVSDILHGITTLQLSGKTKEVFEYQERFNELLEKGDNLEFRQLDADINSTIAKYELTPRIYR